MSKVFCIGHFKTGTTSYSSAAALHGLVDLHFDREYVAELNEAGHAVAWKGRPWDSMSNVNEVEYEELDELYPGSKFVLTTRDVSSWLRSIKKHMEQQWSPPIQRLFNARFQKIFGCDCVPGAFDATTFWEVFEEHDHKVREYFGSSDRLLVLDLDSDEDLMSKLSGFLGRRPQYPDRNKGGYTSEALRRIMEMKPGDKMVLCGDATGTEPKLEEAV
jgi:hypothetical protein